MSGESSTPSVLESLRSALRQCEDVTFQSIRAGGCVPCTLVYISSIVDMGVIQSAAERLLELSGNGEPGPLNAAALYNRLLDGQQFTAPASPARDTDHAIQALMLGAAVLSIDDEPGLILLPAKKYASRAVPDSKNENVLFGPQEAFIEDLDTNLSLLRHKIKHSALKIERSLLGTYTQTSVCLVYMEGLCQTDVRDKVREVIRRSEFDGVLGVSYISEQLESAKFSPFPQIQYTERPDTLAASLLEGRVGILVDGSPLAAIAPITFFSLMQSAEDYFQRYLATSWIRWVRLFFMAISFLLPSVYIAITTFHPEMIPANLLVSIAASRENIPFPTVIEAFMMEISFEGLREAGIRIPKPIGQTVSIIGAIIIGQAAVQAGIVSAPMVIVVSMTGIASFIIPHFELGLSFRLLRFPIMILGGTLGLFGVIIGIFIIYWHMVKLESFGTPYLRPLAPLVFSEWRDTFVRTSWSQLRSDSRKRQS